MLLKVMNIISAARILKKVYIMNYCTICEKLIATPYLQRHV